MVELISSKDQQLNLIFHALADSTRRQILNQLREIPQRVTELAENYRMSLNAVSKHVKVLEKAGLIKRSVRGREHYCALDARKMQQAQQWLETYQVFWNERLDALESYVLDKKARQKRKK